MTHECGHAIYHRSYYSKKVAIPAADTLAELLSENDDIPLAQGATSIVTLEEVRAVLAGKSTQGHTSEVQALIHQQGVKKLSRVDPTHFGIGCPWR